MDQYIKAYCARKLRSLVHLGLHDRFEGYLRRYLFQNDEFSAL